MDFIMLLAAVGLIALCPLLALLCAGLFWWIVGTMAAAMTMIIRRPAK
jgi:hypothetical protein